MPKETVYKPVEKIKPIYAGGTIQPPKFMPSFYEWLSFKGEFITKTTQRGSDGSTTSYTVPANKTFYLLSVSLNGHNDDSASTGISRVYLDSSGKNLLQLEVGVGQETGALDSATTNNIAHNYSIPFKVQESTNIIINQSGGSNLISSVCLQGILVKNNDIPTF